MFKSITYGFGFSCIIISCYQLAPWLGWIVSGVITIMIGTEDPPEDKPTKP